MLDALLKKLIKTSSGRTRFIMAVMGMSVALLLILSSVQLQRNYNDLLYSKTNQDSIANFLVINKQISDKTVGSTVLSDAEIADLKKQSFAEATGILTPSRFKVSAHGNAQIPFYTDLFFESVPDDFLDVKSKDWKWDDQSKFIPMIVPNMFLDMYNFGFATSQNLPQLSQQLVMSLPINIQIETALGNASYYAKVVGFSDRISSVLVPQQFMDWANEKYGSGASAQPSRVVVKTIDAGNPEIKNYLQKHGLTTDADKTRFSKYRQIVDMVVSISWITGAIMLLFALLIFTLFIQLTIASCKDEVALLISLGAAPRQLYRFLLKQFFPVNIFITITVLFVIALLQWILKEYLVSQRIYMSGFISLYTIAAAVAILAVIWWVNSRTIRKYIDKKV